MEPVLAPLGRRALGLLIDQTAAAVPMIVVFLALGYQFDEMVTGTPGFWFNIGFVAIGLLHETIGVARFGRTLGKWITGTRVVHAVSLGAVSLSSALIRSLVPAAFGVVPGIGMVLGMGVYLWAFFDPRRQGIHDKAAGTLVVLNAQPA
ncbi:MAG: RDD family protein [Actinobacteria bacterium]|nr:RDD family protein [Actinomycetota bacterium]